MLLLCASSDDVIEKAGDGEGTNAADGRGDCGKVSARADFVCDVAFQNAFFAGGASVHNRGAGFDVIVNNKPRYARCCDDYIILVKLCQV